MKECPWFQERPLIQLKSYDPIAYCSLKKKLIGVEDCEECDSVRVNEDGVVSFNKNKVTKHLTMAILDEISEEASGE